MKKTHLLAALNQLQDELARAGSIDPAVRERLQRATDELRQALDRDELPAADELEPASSGLRSLLLRFEADHPQLSDVVGRVADALAAMGI